MYPVTSYMKVSLNFLFSGGQCADWVSQKSALLWPEGRGDCPYYTLDHTLRCSLCAFMDSALLHECVPFPPTIQSNGTLFLLTVKSGCVGIPQVSRSVIVKWPKVTPKKTLHVKKTSLTCRCIAVMYSNQNMF